ncbi:MAG: hypothetical protein ACLPWF_16645 [Bryobacteraceae bacterium]
MGKSLLWTALSADRVDHGELQQVIQRHFPSASQPRLREIVYPGDEPHAVKLVYSKTDQLVGIEAGEALTPELEGQLSRAVADALFEPAGYRVQRHVLFADHKLTGSWRYRDWFQVLPVPPSAPQLDCVFGDHPLTHEVRVAASRDSGITNLRASRAMREVLLLLGGLAESSVHGLAGRAFHGSWVSLPGEARQTAYLYPAYPAPAPHSSDGFSAPGAPAPVIPSHDLFGIFGGHAGQPLCIPGELAETIDRYLALDAEARERVLRACYWVQRANRSFPESFSQSFLAVITVAETLMETAKEICPGCGQNQYRLRSSFAAFLDAYVPLDQLTARLAGHPQSFRERLKALYDSRSKITHGSDLPGRDGLAGGFVPGANTEDSDLRTLLRIMPLAVGAWVRERETQV